MIAGLGLALLLISGGSAVAASSSVAAAPAGSTCVWKWKKKRVVRHVRIRHGRRKGRLKRVVRFRRIRVRVCRPAPPPAGPARLGVKAREFGFTLSTRELDAGDTIVELVNQGEDDHNLHLRRIGGDDEVSTPDLRPGQLSRIRLDTQPGSYRLWCSLPFHAGAGMDTTVRVNPVS